MRKGSLHSLASSIRDVKERIGPQCVLQGVLVGAKMVVHLQYKIQQDSTMMSERTLLATRAAC